MADDSTRSSNDVDGPTGPRVPHEDFDNSYKTGVPPWDIGRPQPAFAHLMETEEIQGRVLDVGCGTGEHALMAAAAGLAAAGVDAAPTAIAQAREKAAARALDVRFEVGDVRDLSGLGTRFDTVLDCGLFHVLHDDDRARFVTSLGDAVVSGGRYFLLCFSDRQPGDWGPRRVSQDELRRTFADGWRVDAIEEAALETTFMAEGVRAWLASFTRT